MIAAAQPQSLLTIDPLDPGLMLLSELARLIPGKPRRSTVFGWVFRGAKNKHTGATVRLQTISVPQGMATTRDAYRHFIQQINDPSYEV